MPAGRAVIVAVAQARVITVAPIRVDASGTSPNSTTPNPTAMIRRE
jgi:hypothetical protein